MIFRLEIPPQPKVTNRPNTYSGELIGKNAPSGIAFLLAMRHEHSTSGIKGRVAAILEVIATESPDLLAYQLEILRQGPVRWCTDELASDWRVRPDQLCATLATGVVTVESLRRRRGWRDPAAVVDRPNLSACLAMAEARAARTASKTQRGQLDATCRRLATCLDTERWRDRILAFLDEPGPAASDWLDRFIS